MAYQTPSLYLCTFEDSDETIGGVLKYPEFIFSGDFEDACEAATHRANEMTAKGFFGGQGGCEIGVASIVLIQQLPAIVDAVNDHALKELLDD